MSRDHWRDVIAKPSAGLRLQLLGTPEFQLTGASWRLSDQKAWALLFYLAVTGRAHSRDHLATLLWGESPDSNARHSLRSSLYHLRQALHESGATEILMTNSKQVHFYLDEDQCDVSRFRQLIAAQSEHSLVEAVSLYRGRLLEGFTLTDAPVFEQWLRSEATDFDHAYLDALDRLATWAEARQEWGKATLYAEQIVQYDPLDEQAERRLMQLYLESGATGRALRRYQQFKELLHRELDLTPAPETEELLRSALRPQKRARSSTAAGEAGPDSRRGSQTRLLRAGTESIMPFFGRDDLLARLIALSHGPQAGNGVTLLLQGEAGMGKSRLLEELVIQLSGAGSRWMVLHGSCSPFDDLLSYGPFYEAFQTATSGDLTDLLAVEHGNVRSPGGHIMWRVLQTLQLLTEGGPLLLAIDDLHWANSATLHLFGFLSTRIRTLPVLLVGTIQHPEAIPAMQRLLAVGRHRGEVQLVTVTPLALEAVTGLLSLQGLEPDSSASLGGWLQDRSGGSPFILGEILAQLRADAVLSYDGALWHLNAARWLRQRVLFTLPETTYDLLAWRLAPLSPAVLYLLDVLAVAGAPLPMALLHYLLGSRADESLQTVDDLLTRGLLNEAPGDALALPHHLLRETLLARLSHLRRRTLHLQLLQALEHDTAPDTRAHLRQMALHAVAGEDVERARRYGLQVLDELLQDEPSAEALRFLFQLRDLLLPSAPHGELMRLAHALGQLHQSLGQIEAATHWHQEHLQLALSAEDVIAQATAHFELGELALVTDDYAAAAAAATAGLELYQTLGELGQAALAGRGYRLLGAARAMEGSDLLGAVHYLQQAVAAHTRVSSSDLCADLFELGNVAAQRGELVDALSLYAQAGDAAQAGHAHYFLALAHNNFAYHSLLLGRIDAAQLAATQGQRVAETHELVGAFLHLYSTQGEIHLYLAEWERATQCFRRGLALAEELGNLERQAGYRAGLALAARGQGDFTAAWKLLEDARTLITLQGYWHLQTRILLWLAETGWLRQSFDEAWPPLEEALATAHSQGRVLLMMQGKRLRAQLLAAAGKREEAYALFADLSRQASGLNLPLEVARIQAAHAEASFRSKPDCDEGLRLLEVARNTFITYSARADLLALCVAPV